MNAVFDKVRQLFKGKEDPRLVFMREHDIVWSETQGYIVKGVVLIRSGDYLYADNNGIIISRKALVKV